MLGDARELHEACLRSSTEVAARRRCENAGLGEGKLTLAHQPPFTETGDAFERASQLCHADEVDAMSGFNQREKNLALILQRLH